MTRCFRINSLEYPCSGFVKITLCLQDASERARLGASTFKRLNLALAGASAAAVVAISMAWQGSGAPMHAVPVALQARGALSVALAAFCGRLYVVAKK